MPFRRRERCCWTASGERRGKTWKNRHHSWKPQKSHTIVWMMCCLFPCSWNLVLWTGKHLVLDQMRAWPACRNFVACGLPSNCHTLACLFSCYLDTSASCFTIDSPLMLFLKLFSPDHSNPRWSKVIQTPSDLSGFPHAALNRSRICHQVVRHLHVPTWHLCACQDQMQQDNIWCVERRDLGP